MVRVKRGYVARRRRKKVLQRASGFRGAMSRLYRIADQAVKHALNYSYRDRRRRKRDMRSLWIVRLNAAARQNGLSYSQFINRLKQKDVLLDRKILSDIAIFDQDTFTKIVEYVK